MNFLVLFESFITDLSSEFAESAQVDLLLLALQKKSCVRTRINFNGSLRKRIEKWCNQFSVCYCIDEENFIYLSHSKKLLDVAYALDHSTQPQTAQLGKILGYPRCCSEFGEKIGEMQLDQVEDNYRFTPFEGEYCLINPCYYLQGCALISHIPCSTQCNPSLAIAKSVCKTLLENLHISPICDAFWKRLQKNIQNGTKFPFSNLEEKIW